MWGDLQAFITCEEEQLEWGNQATKRGDPGWVAALQGRREWTRISLGQDRIPSSETRGKVGADGDEFADIIEVEAIIIFH